MITRLHCWIGFLLLELLLPPTAAWGQVRAGGDGLKAAYYAGTGFNTLVRSRVDATIAFGWHHAPPAAGLPAEYFSVRWTGWLVPPVSGRYTFRATVDDGMRIWLNNRLIMNEWRPQPARAFSTTVALQAGQAYELRVDYFQEILDTRAQLMWERPDVVRQPPRASWRNLWGLTATTPPPDEPIAMRYLYSRNPRLAAAATAAPKPLAAEVRPPLPKPSPPLPALGFTTGRTPRLNAGRPASAGRRTAVVAPTVLALFPVSPASPLRPDTAPPIANTDTAQLARLAVGETVTLPDLFFE